MPVIAATDPHTDIGDVVEQAECGYKVLAGDIEMMNKRVDDVIEQLKQGDKLNKNAWKLLQEEYLVERSYKTIMQFVGSGL